MSDEQDKAAKAQRGDVAGTVFTPGILRVDGNGVLSAGGVNAGLFCRWRLVLDSSGEDSEAALESASGAKSIAPLIDLGALSPRGSRFEVPLELGGGIVLNLVRGRCFFAKARSACLFCPFLNAFRGNSYHFLLRRQVLCRRDQVNFLPASRTLALLFALCVNMNAHRRC